MTAVVEFPSADLSRIVWISYERLILRVSRRRVPAVNTIEALLVPPRVVGLQTIHVSPTHVVDIQADLSSRALTLACISTRIMPVPNTVKLLLPSDGRFADLIDDTVPGSKESAFEREPTLEPTEIDTELLPMLFANADRHLTDDELAQTLHSVAVLAILLNTETTLADSIPDP